MPAPVPPGYTRGPILFIGSLPSEQTATTLLQRFWSEAGSYGARLLLLSTAGDSHTEQRLSALFTSWETEAVTVLPVYTRQAAQQTDHLAQIEQATGVLLLDDDPLHLTMCLGGTQLAQAIRRVNARSKVVGALGAGATALCQHMLLPDVSGRPTIAPGFGLVNRLGLVVQRAGEETSEQALAQLITRVAYNPFLIGVGLEVETGIVVYPDTTLEVFGKNQVQIVDGVDGIEADPAALASPARLDQPGWRLHQLAAGYTFSFDQRTVHAPPPSDIPLGSLPVSNVE